MYKKILIGIDGSDDAHKALKKVMDFYKDWKSEIVAFHSIEHHMAPISFPIYGSSYSLLQESYSTIRSEYRTAGERMMEETKKIFKEAEIPIKTRLIEDSKPEHYAVDTAKDESFDLIVLGSKGHHSKMGMILGTVATHVVNNASCDVLIVR